MAAKGRGEVVTYTFFYVYSFLSFVLVAFVVPRPCESVEVETPQNARTEDVLRAHVTRA